MTVPIAQTNRCGCLIIAGGSDTNDNGNVSSNLIDGDAGEDWSDVLNHTQVTTPITDGVRAFHIRCPRGTWANTDGGSQSFFNRCNQNGTVVRVAGCFPALHIATARGATHLTTGLGTFIAGLNSQSCAVTIYNNGIPNYKAPDASGLTNWDANPLTQGNGYPTVTDVTDLTYVRAMYADELDNGCTEFAFDATGGDASTYMLSNILFPMLATAATHTASGFTNSFANSHARKVCVEANPPVDTGSWLTPYSFTARHPTFGDRIGDANYIQPDDMGYNPACIIQTTTQSGYDAALDYLTRGYRVWVKWYAMKNTVGATAMAALLTAGTGTSSDTGSTTTGTGKRLKLENSTRGWRMRSAGWTRR